MQRQGNWKVPRVQTRNNGSLAFGLAEVKVNDGLKEQGLKLAAGVGKGFLTKSVFDVFGAKSWNVAQKGIAMGSTSRLIETGLTPQNYMLDGHFDFGQGKTRAILNAGDVTALGIDVATFGAAHFIPGALSSKLARNPLFTTTLTGGTFGFTAGTLGELQQQLHDKKPISLTKILASGSKEGLLMSAAAATGFKLTPKSILAPHSQQNDATKLIPKQLMLTATETGFKSDGVRDNAIKPESVAPVFAASVESGSQAKDLVTEKRSETTVAKETYGYVGYFLNPASVARTQSGLTINGESVPVRWTAPERPHITDQFGVKLSAADAWIHQNTSTPPKIKVLGIAVDATGVEALHVSVNGQTQRSDGKIYHITRSLAEGRSANESMAVVEKALEVDKARQEGTTGSIKAEQLDRYSYQRLSPEDQFEVEFEPRFRETEKAIPEKPVKPKVEIPFESLPPHKQVVAAIKNTPEDYLLRTISTRTPEQRIGSYFEMTPEQLREALFRTKWEPYDPRDSEGNPIISGGARGYRATINGGRLGMTTVESLPSDAPLYLVDVKGTGKWSLATTGAEGPKTDHVTLIVGPGDGGKPVVWTFHPGEPVRASTLDSGKISEALANSGIDVSGLPASGRERQIPITREQLDRINASLPPESQMSMAKIEDAANLPPPVRSEKTGEAAQPLQQSGLPKADKPVLEPTQGEKVVAKAAEEVRLPGLEALDTLPNQADRIQFQNVYSMLPESMREQYVGELNKTVKNPDVVARTTQVRGIVHEMNRVQRITQQGLEQISPNLVPIGTVEYTGYSRKATSLTDGPNHPLKATVESDVPIVREDGRPYVYELNSSPRRLYGNDAQHRNQILKFQAAIDQGIISGATVEINGRVSPELVHWLNGKAVGDPSPAPNVEVLYNITLPSGGDYTFVLKRAANNDGLRFKNADREFSPEDRKVINGIYKAIQDRSIGNIISGTNIESPPAELAPFLADPFQIKDLNLFNQYDQLRLQSTWNKLTAKADSDRINAENPRNALSEYNTRQYIEEATRWYQDHLKQNPQTAKAKSAYVIKTEAGIEKVVDLASQRAQEIKRYEQERQSSSEETARQKEREALGYKGRPEGIALDMEHIIMDATQEHNKGGNRRGRSYDQPERFQSVEQLMEYMKGQDRLTTQLQLFDPVSGKTEVQTNISEKQISQRSIKVQAENLERARQRVEQNEKRYEELKTKDNRTLEENVEFRALQSRHSGWKMHKAAIEKAQSTIDEITRTRKEGPSISSVPADQRPAFIQDMKTKSAEYDRQIETLRRDIEERYKQILGGDGEWNKLAMRMQVEEQNIMKFVYVVDGEGKIPVAEEVLRGDAAGRAAHSELAGGKNVYGAGELVFAKDATTGEWFLLEINNASGHYRPAGEDTLVYVRNLIAQRGIDTSRAIINDALQRGTPLVDAHLLDVQ